jgi:hypothetical protein
VLQQPVSASVEDGSVVLTLTVFDPAQPAFVQETQVVMGLDDAKHAVVQLRRAVDEATEHGGT